MRIRRADQENLELSEMNDVVRELLHRLPGAADPESDPDVLQRLYPTPTGGVEPEADEEWQELIGSELEEHFAGAMSVVEEDLQRLPRRTDDEDAVWLLPVNHLDQWINALNQARLAIHARHGFSEKEMASMPDEDHPHALPLLQMDFYGRLLERFLWELTGESG